MIMCLYELLYSIPLLILILDIVISYVFPYIAFMDTTSINSLIPLADTGITYNIILYIISILLLVILTVGKNTNKKMRGIIWGFPIFVAASVFGICILKNELSIIMYYEEFGVLLTLVIITYLLTLGLISKTLVRRVGLLLVVTNLIVMDIYQIHISRVEFAIAVFYLLIILADEIQYRWKKSGYTDRKIHLICVAPLMLAICIFIYFIPVSNKPMNWDFAINAWNKVIYEMNKISGKLFHLQDEYTEVGFSEDGNIKGGIVSNEDKDVLLLTCGKNCGNAIYLSGKSFDKFDGRGWTNSDISENNNNFSNSRMLDTLETQTAILKFDPNYTRDYISNSEIQIEYRLYNTKYIFVPEKFIIDKNFLLNMQYEESSKGMLSKGKLNFGDKYRISYYRMNLTSDLFTRLVNKSSEITEEDWNVVLEKNRIASESNYSYEKYQEYVDSIYSIYGNDVVISNELRDELNSIWSTENTDYEKMRLLEQYFKSFKYTLAPEVLPNSINDETDFLDYFMLNKKEGYCVHFATAFVLIARAEGIPARYVQGYYVPRDGSIITIKSSMAHAWPELYFENVGWISFDPAPGFNGDLGWSLVNRSNDGEKVITDETPGETLDYENNFENSFEDKETTDDNKIINYYVMLKLVLYILITFAVFAVIMYFLNLQHQKKIYKRLSMLEKLKYISTQNLFMLKKYGLGIKPGETLTEYQERISNQITPKGIEFISGYEISLYSKIDENKPEGNKEIEQFLKIAIESQTILKSELKKKVIKK